MTRKARITEHSSTFIQQPSSNMTKNRNLDTSCKSQKSISTASSTSQKAFSTGRFLLCPDDIMESCPIRIVRDTRVKAFTLQTAKKYLRDKNVLSVYCPLNEYTWEIISQDPEQELVQAYNDLAMAEAFGAEDRFLAFCMK